jgi:hypothetical protein
MSVNLHILLRAGPIDAEHAEELHRTLASVLRRHGIYDDLECRASTGDEIFRCTHPKRPVSLTGLSRFLPALEKDLARSVRAAHGRSVRASLEVSDADDRGLSSAEQLKLMRRIARERDAVTSKGQPARARKAAPPIARPVPYKFCGTFTRPVKELEALAAARGHPILRGSTFDTEGVVVNGKGPRALDGATRALLRKEGARIISEADFEAELGEGR